MRDTPEIVLNVWQSIKNDKNGDLGGSVWSIHLIQRYRQL